METIKLLQVDTAILFNEARIKLRRFCGTGCAAKTLATVTFSSLNLISLFAFCFNIFLNDLASFSSVLGWLKRSVDGFVFVTIFIIALLVVETLKSFSGRKERRVVSELFH